MLEVELKLPVADLDAVEARLQAMGARREATEVQADTYFAHPVRDFAATDEALRLRRGASMELTYKGPRQDAHAKVREEHNIPVGEDPTPALEALGFKPVVQVTKRRRTWDLDGTTVCLDDVDDVGQYVEIEQLGGEPRTVEAVARRLGLDPATAEPRSYLEMLGTS